MIEFQEQITSKALDIHLFRRSTSLNQPPLLSVYLERISIFDAGSYFLKNVSKLRVKSWYFEN